MHTVQGSEQIIVWDAQWDAQWDTVGMPERLGNYENHNWHSEIQDANYETRNWDCEDPQLWGYIRTDCLYLY